MEPWGVARRGWTWLLVVLLTGAAQAGAPSAFDASVPEAWAQAGTSSDARRFSTLDRIDRSNVSDLALVWSREIGRADRFQAGVAAHERILYLIVDATVLAIDARTGEDVWTVDVGDDRGVSEVRTPPPPARGTPLVLGDVVLVAYRTDVVALDRTDGSERWRTDVRAGGWAEHIAAHPIHAGDVVVVGTTADRRGPIPGRVMALDAKDGTVAWSFYTIPQDPSDPAFSTWQPTEPSWSQGIGGGGVLNAGAYDADSDTVIFGTGTPTPWERLDYRRSNEGPASADLYTSSFVALEAATGNLRWHLPVVPGDEWEYDQSTIPIVADMVVGDRMQRVAMLATTTGYLVVVRVSDGGLLRAHRAAPAANVHLGYDEAGAPIIDDGMRGLGERSAERVCPGPRWAGVAPAAYSHRTGLLYRPNEIACMQMGNRPLVESDDETTLDPIWLRSEPRRTGDYHHRWGGLTAIDPLTGNVRWEYATPYPHDAGALVTAGDVVFSAFADRTFRAFDAASGEVLWSHVLTAHSEAVPVTYLMDGIQYVLIAVGHPTGRRPMPSSDAPESVAGAVALFAFTLSEPR